MIMGTGAYYIGDLCYVMTDSEWSEICSKIEKDGMGTHQLNDGRYYSIFNTAFGDGCYYDVSGNEYPVDSGTIGCIKVTDIDDSEIENIENSGIVHEFTGHVNVDTDGRYIEFSDDIIVISIDTDPQDLYDEDVYQDYFDEDDEEDDYEEDDDYYDEDNR